MHPVLKNVLAVIIGAIVGGIVNMGIITISGSIVPLPEGVDASNIESIKANMHLYEFKHFLMPFLAHALGTLVGAIVATLMAANRGVVPAIIIGLLFLVGGVLMVMQLPSPLYFNIMDLGLAYIPMALLGWFMFKKKK